MQFTHYLRALKRMWPIVAGLCLLGAIGGWLTTPAPAQKSNEHYYKATAVLIADENEATRAQNEGKLQQAAFLVNHGDTPVRVGQQLGLDPNEVASRVSGLANSDTLVLQITALGTDAQETILLADTSASQLVSYLGEKATATAATDRDDAIRKIDAYKQRVDAIEALIALQPSAAEVAALKAERSALENQQRIENERLARIAAEGTPSAGISLVENSKAVEIGKKAYEARLQTIKDGLQPIQRSSGPSTTVPSDAVEAPPPPPDPTIRTIIGAIFGLCMGVGLVIGIDRFDTRLRSKHDTEEAFGLPVIAEIPPLARPTRSSTAVVAFEQPRSRITEAFRSLRTSVMFVRSISRPDVDTTGGNGTGGNGAAGTGDPDATIPDERTPTAESGGNKPLGRVLMVTSPGPEDGKTTTVANLAAVLAEAGLSVLLVNCDFRRPRLHRFLDPTITGKGDLDGPALLPNGEGTVVRTMVPGVRLVTHLDEGDDDVNPAEVCAKQLKVIERARKYVDIILLDTAPLLTTNDAAELLPECDLVILVAHTGKTKWEAAERSSELLSRLDARVLGVVLTNSVDAPSGQYYYYYLDRESGLRSSARASRDQVRVRKSKRLDEASADNGDDTGDEPLAELVGPGAGNGNGSSGAAREPVGASPEGSRRRSSRRARGRKAADETGSGSAATGETGSAGRSDLDASIFDRPPRDPDST